MALVPLSPARRAGCLIGKRHGRRGFGVSGDKGAAVAVRSGDVTGARGGLADELQRDRANPGQAVAIGRQCAGVDKAGDVDRVAGAKPLNYRGRSVFQDQLAGCIIEGPSPGKHPARV
jgi:hypothetical protein